MQTTRRCAFRTVYSKGVGLHHIGFNRDSKAGGVGNFMVENWKAQVCPKWGLGPGEAGGGTSSGVSYVIG